MEINELWLKQVVRDFLKTGLLQRKIKDLSYSNKEGVLKEFMRFYFELGDYARIDEVELLRGIYEAPRKKTRKHQQTGGGQQSRT
jgi:hypothetical protein